MRSPLFFTCAISVSDIGPVFTRGPLGFGWQHMFAGIAVDLLLLVASVLGQSIPQCQIACQTAALASSGCISP
jgi:hypothetical protein